MAENLSLRPRISTGQALSLTYGRFFAEFLEDLSLVRLTLLELTTCVGFGTDVMYSSLEDFLGTVLSILSPSVEENRGFAWS